MFRTTEGNLVRHLSEDLKIKADDFVFLHSRVIGLGLLDGGVETITNAFDRVLGRGTLFIPTFSYSWCEGKTYRPEESPPVGMGSYVEAVWQNPRFIRSRNANFSVAALSNDHNLSVINRVFDTAASCFGKRSVFDNLYCEAKNGASGHILLLGGALGNFPFHTTVLHYVEEINHAPYRYVKPFQNPDDASDFIKQCVRYISADEYKTINKGKIDAKLKFPIIADYGPLGRDLRQSGHLRERPFAHQIRESVLMGPFAIFLARRFGVILTIALADSLRFCRKPPPIRDLPP